MTAPNAISASLTKCSRYIAKKLMGVTSSRGQSGSLLLSGEVVCHCGNYPFQCREHHTWTLVKIMQWWSIHHLRMHTVNKGVNRLWTNMPLCFPYRPAQLGVSVGRISKQRRLSRESSATTEMHLWPLLRRGIWNFQDNYSGASVTSIASSCHKVYVAVVC